MKEMLQGLRRELAAERKALHDEARELKASLDQQRALDQHLLRRDREKLQRDQARLVAEREACREALTDINVYRCGHLAVHTYTHTRMHTYTHTHLHTRIHTRMLRRAPSFAHVHAQFTVAVHIV